MIAFTVTMNRPGNGAPYEIVVILPAPNETKFETLHELVAWLATTGRVYGMSTSDTLSGIREFRNGDLVNAYVWLANESDIREASEGTRTRG